MITVNLTDPPLGLAACDYINDGLAVLPCEPGGKRPLWGLGWEDASTEPEQIMEWWGMEPRANIGVACTGDLVVLDVDGPPGEETLEELGLELPPTHEVMTGRGRHLYFTRPEGLTDGWRWGDLELKASGYVLAPPSVHPSGAWYWSSNGTERAPLLSGLTTSPRPVYTPPRVTPPRMQDLGRLQRAARAALTGELDKLDAHSTEHGTGRHTALYAAAAALGHHVASGGLTGAEVQAALWAAAGRLGLPEDPETHHQIVHGLEEGMAEPYVLTDRPMPPSSSRIGTSSVAGEQAKPPTMRSRKVAEVKLRSVEWAWDQRLPLGKLTVLGGLPGQGKSMLTCWLASRASKGLVPGDLYGHPTDVLLVSAEDDPEDTILPRILRTGGDTDRIHVLDVREPGTEAIDPYTRAVSLPEDTPGILEALERTDAKLVVLDPVGGLLDMAHDSYKAQHVRHALGPLKAAAEERRAAVLLVHHVLTKGQSNQPLERLADSHAFVGLPRSVLIMGPDPDDEAGDRGTAKVLLVAKSNLAGPGEHGLRFKILDGGYVSDGRPGGVGWSASIQEEGATSSTAADSLATPDDRSALREAKDFLREILGDSAEQAGVVQAAAESAGISQKTLRRAREQICIRPYKNGPGPWWWRLRAPAHAGEGYGHLGQDGHLPEPRRDAEGAQGAQGAQGPTRPREGSTILQMFPDGPEEPPSG